MNYPLFFTQKFYSKVLCFFREIYRITNTGEMKTFISFRGKDYNGSFPRFYQIFQVDFFIRDLKKLEIYCTRADNNSLDKCFIEFGDNNSVINEYFPIGTIWKEYPNNTFKYIEVDNSKLMPFSSVNFVLTMKDGSKKIYVNKPRRKGSISNIIAKPKVTSNVTSSSNLQILYKVIMKDFSNPTLSINDFTMTESDRLSDNFTPRGAPTEVKEYTEDQKTRYLLVSTPKPNKDKYIGLLKNKDIIYDFWPRDKNTFWDNVSVGETFDVSSTSMSSMRSSFYNTTESKNIVYSSDYMDTINNDLYRKIFYFTDTDMVVIKRVFDKSNKEHLEEASNFIFNESFKRSDDSEGFFSQFYYRGNQVVNFIVIPARFLRSKEYNNRIIPTIKSMAFLNNGPSTVLLNSVYFFNNPSNYVRIYEEEFKGKVANSLKGENTFNVTYPENCYSGYRVLDVKLLNEENPSFIQRLNGKNTLTDADLKKTLGAYFYDKETKEFYSFTLDNTKTVIESNIEYIDLEANMSDKNY